MHLEGTGMKVMLRLVVGLIVVGGIVAGLVLYERHVKAGQVPAAASAQTAKIERGSIFQAVASTGRVVSNLDVDIKCRASGQVVKLPFDVSQSVKKDDLLLQLDPADQTRSV